MEVCTYEQDPGTLLCHGPNPLENVSNVPDPELPVSGGAAVGAAGEIVILDSSRIAMQIASGQIVWPIVAKPKDILSKLEHDLQQGLPYIDANGELHPTMESTDLASAHADAAMKCQVRKRQREDGEAQEGDGYEKQAIMRWKDVWVAQLIHIRGRMHAAFMGPQKQRVDLWQVVKNEMARTCHGFDKDSEACRKKWRRVHKEYKDFKCLQAAGNCMDKCRFYDLMEYYMGEKANKGHHDPQLPPGAGYGAASLVGFVKEEEQAVPENEGKADIVVGSPSLVGEARSSKRPYKRKGQTANEVTVHANVFTQNSLPSLLSELVSIGKEMLETTRRYEQEKIDVLLSLKDKLREISKQI